MPCKGTADLATRVPAVIARRDDPKAPKLPASLESDINHRRESVAPFLAAASKADDAFKKQPPAAVKARTARDALQPAVAKAPTADKTPT